MQNDYHIETYADFVAFTEVYFAFSKNIFSVFLILLTKEITCSEPEVSENGEDFSVAE